MLNIYTVSFFGHREVSNFFLAEEQVENLIQELFYSKEYVDFLVGRNGDFDQIVSSTIIRVKKDCGEENCSHILMLPYSTKEYRDNIEAFYEYYDLVDIYTNADRVHYKSVIQKRNQDMVDRSDLVVFYLERDFGGAYKTYRYALKQEKNILKLPIEYYSTKR